MKENKCDMITKDKRIFKEGLIHGVKCWLEIKYKNLQYSLD